MNFFSVLAGQKTGVSLTSVAPSAPLVGGQPSCSCGQHWPTCSLIFCWPLTPLNPQKRLLLPRKMTVSWEVDVTQKIIFILVAYNSKEGGFSTPFTCWWNSPRGHSTTGGSAFKTHRHQGDSLTMLTPSLAVNCTEFHFTGESNEVIFCTRVRSYGDCVNYSFHKSLLSTS